MKTNNKSLKTLVFSLGLAAMMLSATNLNAQERPGGLFGTNQSKEAHQDGLMKSYNRDAANINGMTNQTFETPLGGGIAILLAAGIGYVALKKKEDEQ